MRAATRMMLMGNRPGQNEMRRSEYGGGNDRRMIGYDRDPERERPSNMYPHMPHVPPYYGGYDRPESRRRRDSRGRYMMGGGYDGPYYGEEDEDDDYSPHMTQGRVVSGEGRFSMTYPPDETEYRRRSSGGVQHQQMGHMPEEMDERSARAWVKSMRNSDGTTGEHFTAEQAEQHRKVICPDCSKWDFYAALNMVYSDYAAVAKKMGVDRPEYYAHMAKAFLCDEDAEDGKLVKYKEYIAG